MNHFVSVAGLVRNDRGEILLLLSPDRGWEYPGGMVEPGETLQEALKREIFEETGVTAEITAFAGVSKNLGRDIVNVDFLCRYVGGDLRTSEESLEVRWVTPEEAENLVTLPVTQKRLAGMRKADGQVYCFSFRREPYGVYDDQVLPVR